MNTKPEARAYLSPIIPTVHLQWLIRQFGQRPYVLADILWHDLTRLQNLQQC